MIPYGNNFHALDELKDNICPYNFTIGTVASVLKSVWKIEELKTSFFITLVMVSYVEIDIYYKIMYGVSCWESY
jgi:hypothetical protein